MAWCIRFIVAALIFPSLVAAPSWAVAGQRNNAIVPDRGQPAGKHGGQSRPGQGVRRLLLSASAPSRTGLPGPAHRGQRHSRGGETDQPAAKLQEIALSSAINGRLLESKEEERYRLPVQPGMKLRFDFLAERAGSARRWCADPPQ